MFIFIFIFILTILVLVVIHELGHFLAAKKFNIKVLEFGFGIPPRIWGKKVGETLVSINWLPFGGFVRLLGEDEVDEKALKDKRSFAQAPVWKRIVVVVAGVVMNLLLAWILFYIIIIWNGFKIVLPAAQPLVVIEKVEPTSPAAEVGIKAGDKVLSINKAPVQGQADFSDQIKKNAGQVVNLEIEDQAGAKKTVQVTPRANPPFGQGPLGIATSPFLIRSFETPIEKIFSGPIYSYELIKLSIPGFGQLFADLANKNFEKASEQVAGPIGIVVISNSILENGSQAIVPYLYFIALLSLNLAVINVLPFPGLDGGRLFFLIIEAITRKRTHAVVEKYVHTIGLAILLSLILLITISDIKKIIY